HSPSPARFYTLSLHDALPIWVGQSLISQIERGERSLSEDLIETTVKEFNLPRGYFTDRDPVRYDRFSLNYRRNSLSAKTQDRLLYNFGETEQDIQASSFPIPTLDLSFPRPNGREKLSIDEVENAAHHARRILQLPTTGPIPNVMRSIEAAGIVISPMLIPGENLSKFDAVSSPEHPEQGPLVIAYAPQEAGDRQRFTIAHELGHIILHLRNRPKEEAVREGEAHQFAGA